MSSSNLAFYFAVITTSVACGGGSDGRSETAPPLPFPRQDAPCSEIDDLSDGSIDVVYNYKYDSDGFIVESATQGSIAKTTYGKDHFETRFEVATTAGGTPVFTVDTNRDSDGRRLRVETTDIAQDGKTVTLDTFTYDSAGRPIGSMSTETVTPTAGAPTTRMRVVTVTYTGDSLIPSVVLSTTDGVATRSTYVQSNGGLAVEISVDQGDNGSVELVTKQTFDSEGRVLTTEDTEAGMITLRERSMYDQRGVEIMYTLDFDGTDPLDVSDTTTYVSGMRTKEVLTSPSNNFAMFIFTENYKATCVAVSARTNPTVHDHVRHLRDLRMGQRDRASLTKSL